MGINKGQPRTNRKQIIPRAASLALLVTIIVAGSVTAFHAGFSQTFRSSASKLVAKHALEASADDADNIAVADSDVLPAWRHLYPYSVIPGGVQSGAELRTAAQNDPVVARHYADFDLAKARVISLDRDQMVYVSYRMGEEVFWTNRALKLPKGETVITDGVHEARTRCGNRISETPQAPLSPQQPALETFNRVAPVGPLYASNLPIDGQLTPPSPYTPSAPIQPLANEHSDFAAPFFMYAPGPGFGGGSGSLYSNGTGPTNGSGSSSSSGTAPGAGGSSGPGSSPGSPGAPGSPSGGSGSPSGPSSPSSPGSPLGSPTGPQSPGGPPISTPEPGTLLLLTTGLVGLLCGRKLLKRDGCGR